jgi:hypothetical protein
MELMPEKAVHKLALYPKSASSTCVFDLLKTLFLVFTYM